MKDISTWQVAIFVLLTQIGFLYLRTLNVRAVAQGKILKAVMTGNGIALCWLISTSISIYSVMNLEALPIISHLVGGSIGTIIAMRSDSSRKERR